MPNLCDYTMKIVGEKEKIATLIKYLQNDYWYAEDGNSCRPSEEQIKKYSLRYEEGDWKLYTNAEKEYGISISDEEWKEKGYISRCEINPYAPEWSI